MTRVVETGGGAVRGHSDLMWWLLLFENWRTGTSDSMLALALLALFLMRLLVRVLVRVRVLVLVVASSSSLVVSMW